MNKSNTLEIINFLEKSKALLLDGKYDFVPRRKNMQSLAKYGMTLYEAKNEIMGLVLEDYYKGPKKDLDPKRQGDIWEFKKSINGVWFYVKLKIVTENENEVLKCLGFHEDEFK